MATGSIRPHQPVTAPADLMAQARTNCAERARAREEHDGAAAYERGAQDQGWALRHEVDRLRREAAAAAAVAERRFAAEDNLDLA